MRAILLVSPAEQTICLDMSVCQRKDFIFQGVKHRFQTLKYIFHDLKHTFHALKYKTLALTGRKYELFDETGVGISQNVSLRRMTVGGRWHEKMGACGVKCRFLCKFVTENR